MDMMQGGFEFWIDGTQFSDPINWKDFTETIEHDESLNVFLFKYETKLTFSGGAYEYLYNKRNELGFSYVASIVVKRRCTENGDLKDIFTGTIFISDCIFYINKCMVDCSIQDNNFAYSLFNNKNIKVCVETYKSKNGVVYSSIPTNGLGLQFLNTPNYFRLFIDLFVPSNGTPFVSVGNDIQVFFVHDLFNYLICYLTDGNCTFKSDYLNYTLPITKESEKVRNLMLTTGYNIRVVGTNTQIPMSISFQDLFTEVNRLYPLVLFVEYDSSGKPIIRIEDFDSVRQSASSILLNDLENVIEKADNSLLYGTAKVGTQIANYDSSIHSYIPIQELTFGDEIYYINGYVNTSTEKNLFGDFLIDSNIIEELLITNNTNTEYDSNYFFIEVDPFAITGGARYDARKTANYDNNTKFHYNDNLLNVNVLKRNKFHDNASLSSGIGGGNLNNYSNNASSVVALGTQYDCASITPVAPQTSSLLDLSFVIDNASVFDGTEYTALVSGNYSFYYSIVYTLGNDITVPCYGTTINRNVTFTTLVRHYDSVGTLLNTFTYTDTTKNAPANVVIEFYPSFVMTAGDYIKASSSYTSIPIDYTKDSSVSVSIFIASGTAEQFNTTSTPASSGLLFNQNGFSYDCNIINFDTPLAENIYNDLKNNIDSSIEFNINNYTNKKGWIRRVSRIFETGETNFELITNISSIN